MQPRAPLPGRAARPPHPPHPATLGPRGERPPAASAQRSPLRGPAAPLPPHPATVAQPRAPLPGRAASPPHPATLEPRRRAPGVAQPSTYSSDYPFHSGVYSDSDEDDEATYKAMVGKKFEHPQQKKKGYKEVEVEVYNATKWHSYKSVRQPGVDNTVRAKAEIPDLQADAKAIHDAAAVSRPEALTIVCALLVTKKKALKKFCFSNLDATLDAAARKKAHDLKYHVIYANQAHAEVEMIQYMALKGYTLFAMGCDKAHCPECNRITHDVVGGKYPTMTGVGASTFANYYMPPIAVKRWKGTDAKRSDEHRPKADAGFAPDDLSRKRSLAEMTGDADFAPTGAPGRTYYASPPDRKKRRKATVP